MTRYTLEVRCSTEPTRSVSIPPQGLNIGRGRANDLVLSSPAVSRQHARVSVEEGRIVVTDLGSLEGTYVHGARVASGTVSVGDVIEIGPFELEIVSRRPESASVTEVTDRSEAISGLLDDFVRLASLTGVSDLQSILETLLELSMPLVAASRGFVVLVKEGELSPVLARHGARTEEEDAFSRTVCSQAIASARPVLMADEGERCALRGIRSLVASSTRLVLGIPLIDMNEVLGILYLESGNLTPQALGLRPQLLDELSILGGRALRAAYARRQLVLDQSRWRWLASDSIDDVDILRCGRSPAMQKTLQTVRKASREDVTVMVRGETGTGKEMVARTLHRLSPRRDGPFVALNCGAIPRDLLEAELFGYEKGAFTGATLSKPGRLEMADGGTLLLDEVGDLPLDLQVKLLRVLESRRITRLGAMEDRRIDVRLLAATNVDLEKAITERSFREDLYYRLNVVTIVLPPLRERSEDLEPLVSDMLLMANRRFRRKLYGVTPEALILLRRYPWPGNVRELRNVIERAFILEPGPLISPPSLPFDEGTQFPKDEEKVEAMAPPGELMPLDEYLACQESSYIRLVLDRTAGNVTAAARILGMNRCALHRKIRRLRIRGVDRGS